MFRYLSCYMLSGILFLHGCGQAESVHLGLVTGVVTLDNEPLRNVLISFTPVQGGRPSFGITGNNGRYELDYSSKRQGALIGSHIVHIATALEGSSAPRKNGVTGPTTEEKIPEKYRTKEGTVVIVKSGRNTMDFALMNK